MQQTIGQLSILRLKQVKHKTGLCRSSIYLFINAGSFPKPIQLGSRAVGWLEHEIDEWMLSRINQRDLTMKVH